MSHESHELDDQGSIRGRYSNLSLSHRVQSDSGAYPASYPMDTVGPFPEGKAAGA